MTKGEYRFYQLRWNSETNMSATLNGLLSFNDRVISVTATDDEVLVLVFGAEIVKATQEAQNG